EPGLQLARGGGVLLHEAHVGGAARQGFEPERAAAGEQVEAARAVHRAAEPVEERLAYAVGRGADRRRGREPELAPAPAAANDAQRARPAAAPDRRRRAGA